MNVQVRALEVIEVTVMGAKGRPTAKTIFPVQDTKNASGAGGVLWLMAEGGGKSLGSVAYATPDDRGQAMEDLAEGVRKSVAGPEKG